MIRNFSSPPGDLNNLFPTAAEGRTAYGFFPDPASHAPHFALGMVKEFTVK